MIPVLDPSTRQVVVYRIVKLVAREAAGQREVND